VCEDRTAVLIAAGTELTEGIIQDTHARFLASELSALGFRVRRSSLIPDDAALFRSELARACADACLVLVTGGLGPTTDDLTREIVAEAAGEPLVFHQDAWETLVARFAGRTVSDTNRKQATAPRGFSLIPNPNGTAPGFHGTVSHSLVVAMPGPPSELRPMFSASVLPLIRERFGAPSSQDMLWGTAMMVPESTLEEGLQACARSGITWGTRVEEDRISFSLRGGTAADRAAFFDALADGLGRDRVRAGETRPSVLLTEALLARGTTMVAAESCTGGLIAKYLTDLQGSSRVLWGGFVTYSYEAKTALLDVPAPLLDTHGAVSRECVSAMAAGALARSPAGIALAVSGIAGPDGGTVEKPVGTVWIAARLRDGREDARRFGFSGSRDMVRRRTAVAGMLLAEALLAGRPFLDTRPKW
jgi:nicotinamide-nucleotide amidase